MDRFSVFHNQKIERWGGAVLRLLSRFLRALFQFSKRAAGEAAKFGRSGVKLLGVVGAARLECGEPAAESGELIRRQLGNSFGDFFDFHGAQLTFKFVRDKRAQLVFRVSLRAGQSRFQSEGEFRTR